jgi:hypothetical protein
MQYLIQSVYEATMLRRLFSLFLVIALAIPAVSASSHAAASPCAATQPTTMPAMHDDGADHKQSGDHGQPGHEQAAGHGCIGCIAPIAQLPFAFTAPALIGPALPRWIAHALPSRHSGPETPPPKTS